MYKSYYVKVKKRTLRSSHATVTVQGLLQDQIHAQILLLQQWLERAVGRHWPSGDFRNRNRTAAGVANSGNSGDSHIITGRIRELG